MANEDATEKSTDDREVEVKLIVDDETVSLWWDNAHIAEFGREWYEQAKEEARDEDRPIEAVVSQAVDEHTDVDIAEMDWIQ